MNTVSILIIATAHALLGGTGAQTGLWLEELTTPYYAFADQGASITIATLPGGRIPIDPHSLAAAGKNPPTVERYLKDADLQRTLRRLNATSRTQICSQSLKRAADSRIWRTRITRSSLFRAGTAQCGTWLRVRYWGSSCRMRGRAEPLSVRCVTGRPHFPLP